MPFFLKLESGTRTGTMLPITAQAPITIGRSAEAAFPMAEDNFLSRVHFQILVDGQRCVLRDLNSSNGTTCNGVRVTEIELKGNEEIVAGQSRFSLVVEQDAAPANNLTATLSRPAAVALPEEADRAPLLAVLQHWMQPLYGVLDAAQSPEVLTALLRCGAYCYSLFVGEEAAALGNFAPYLVALPSNSPMLPLLTQAWGKNWGIFLRSERSFPELYAWLQRLLVVQAPDGRNRLLRFYDPRVLRDLLPACTPQQLYQIFSLGNIFLMESGDPAVAAGFALEARGLLHYAIPTASAEPVQTSLLPEIATPPYDPRLPAPQGMLSLSQDQLEKLESKPDPFEQSVLAFLEKTYPAECEAQGRDAVAALVRAGSGRSQRYGLKTDDEVRRFIVLMLLLGAEFDTDPQLGWAANILSKRKPGAEKIVALEAAARAHLRPD